MQLDYPHLTLKTIPKKFAESSLSRFWPLTSYNCEWVKPVPFGLFLLALRRTYSWPQCKFKLNLFPLHLLVRLIVFAWTRVHDNFTRHTFLSPSAQLARRRHEQLPEDTHAAHSPDTPSRPLVPYSRSTRRYDEVEWGMIRYADKVWGMMMRTGIWEECRHEPKKMHIPSSEWLVISPYLSPYLSFALHRSPGLWEIPQNSFQLAN